MTDDDVAELLTAMELAWPRPRPDGWQKVWAPNLRDLPLGPALQAMNLLIRTKSFPPSVAEVREATADAMGLLPPADGAEQGLRYASAWDRSEMMHTDPPEPPCTAVQTAIDVFGGPFVVVGDPEGWTRFWRGAEKQVRDQVLLSDIGMLAIGP